MFELDEPLHILHDSFTIGEIVTDKTCRFFKSQHTGSHEAHLSVIFAQ